LKARRVVLRRGESPGVARITRRDFLKIGGTGLAGAALLGTAGCGVFQQGGGQQGGGGGGNSITVQLEGPIRDMDSTTTTDSVSTEVLQHVMCGLYRLDEDTKPVPAMAESVDISEDGLNYTFTLRDGIQWSNGDPVTSHDFKYAWLRALDPDTAGQYAYIISTFVKGADEFNTGKGSAEDVAIETPDDKTLEVTLLNPAPFWLGLTSFFTYYPQNQKFVEKQGDNYAQNENALLYNGPYTLTSFSSTKGVSYVKNKDYWDAENVDIAKIDAEVITEVATGVNLFESGQLDEMEISSTYVSRYRGKPEFYSTTEFATGYLTPNLKVPILQNENIRRAIQMGFDREAVNDKIINDGSTAATGFVPDGIAGPGDQTFREAEGPSMPDYEPQKAKELWQKGVQEVGENPEIELLVDDETEGRDFATFVQSQFEKMGAKISVNVQPFDRRLELEANGQFQLVDTAWIADYDDPMTFLDLFESTSAYNTSGYKNERYDQLIRDARKEADSAKRMDMLLEAERILLEDDAAIAPWRFYGAAYLVRPTIKNFVAQPYGGGRDYSFARLEG
jgi:oligopeptide transport system substrate-binding protein